MKNLAIMCLSFIILIGQSYGQTIIFKNFVGMNTYVAKDDIFYCSPNNSSMQTDEIAACKNIHSLKNCFNSWNEVWSYLMSGKKFVTQTNYSHDYVNEIVTKLENDQLVMTINGVIVGQIGYDSRTKDKFDPNNIKMLLRVVENDYPLNGGVKRDYVISLKINEGGEIYMYFEPMLTENFITHEKFYEYYIPMFENGELRMGFSTARTYDECKFIYYYAVD